MTQLCKCPRCQQTTIDVAVEVDFEYPVDAYVERQHCQCALPLLDRVRVAERALMSARKAFKVAVGA